LSVGNPIRGFGALSAGYSDPKTVTLSGAVMPGDIDAGGELRVIGRSLILTDDACLDINMFGADNYGCLTVTNMADSADVSVDIGSNAELNLEIAPAFKAYPGDSFVILRNTGAGGTAGEFADYPEGSRIFFRSATGKLTYEFDADGDGVSNDIVITDIRPGGTVLIIK
ncbi:MAG: hypothetical protein FWG05_00725, partial [Kiritimatiellaeota bacterium]|nr:hypothetical protein [Kiritimatiellota bacterium]